MNQTPAKTKARPVRKRAQRVHSGTNGNEASPGEESFRAATDCFPGLLWTALPGGEVDFHNLRWLEYTGMSLEDSCGFGWRDAYHPEDVDHLATTWKQVVAAGIAGEAKARLRRHDGVYRWFLVRACPHKDDHGKIIKWYGLNIDIDDLKRAEEMLAGEKLLLERIVRGGPLHMTLDLLCQIVNETLAGVSCGVVLRASEGGMLRFGAAPALPPDFLQQADQHLPTSYGNTRFQQDTRFSCLHGDASTSPEWQSYVQYASSHGLRTLCIVPIVSSAGMLLGSFHLHAAVPPDLSAEQQIYLDQLIQLAAVALERDYIDAALKESEERFRLMAETTPDVIWVTEFRPERVLYVSPSFEHLWGHKPEDLYKNPRLWIDMVHPEDVQRVSSVFEHAASMNTSSRYDINYRLLHPDGRFSWIYERGVFVHNPVNRTLRASGISTDVTKLKQAEEALKASQERFALAVAASTDGIWDWDIKRDTLFMSNRAQCIFGLEATENERRLSHWRQTVRVHPNDADIFGRELEAFLAGKNVSYDHELRVYNLAGEIKWIRVRGQCVRDVHGQPTRLAGSVSDIDMQKRTEASLEQSRRLEALGTLAGGIAHDFNNILGAVLGYGEMALRGAEKNARQLRDINNIIKAGKRGKDLVSRILAFSRSGGAERSRVSVDKVLQETLGILNPTLPPGITMEIRVASALPPVCSDPTQIHQIVINLLTNAVHAMPDGGTLQISLSTEFVSAKRPATTGTVDRGKYIVLKVQDTGMGISPGVMSRIFDPFFTTKEVGVGTGLGLTLVHAMVADLGGTIDVASAPNEGALFIVRLPCARKKAEPPAALPGDEDRLYQSPPRQVTGQGKHILIVDDEEALAQLSAQILDEVGFVPHVCTSGKAALKAFRDDPDRYSMLLSDERMPQMPGSALAAEIRKIRPAIPVLLVSGHFGDSTLAATEASGLTEILKKPVPRSDLIDAVTRLLAAA
jgi:PAS domain S-box-containing protein